MTYAIEKITGEKVLVLSNAKGTAAKCSIIVYRDGTRQVQFNSLLRKI